MPLTKEHLLQVEQTPTLSEKHPDFIWKRHPDFGTKGESNL